MDEPPRRGGTDRRRLLKYGGGAVAALAVAGGGWLAFDALSGGGGPAGTVRGFLNAVGSGDVEAANGYIHPEAPMGKLSQDEVSSVSSVSIQNVEVVSESGDRATVRVKATVESEFGSSTNEVTYELRKSGGEWKLWGTSN